MTKYDLCFAFDDTEYLNPQIYLFFNSLKDKIDSDILIHINTTREDNDKPLRFITDNFNTRIYHNEHPDLKSRCRYMLNAFKIESSNEWVIKMELDMVALNHINNFTDILDNRLDCILETENRRIIQNDRLEKNIWNRLYNLMDIEEPNIRMTFRENSETGRPLFGTGVICVKNDIIPIINNRWVDLTRMCETMGEYGIHPNEFGFTAMVFDEGWKWKIYDRIYKFNPIGAFRKNPFPSQELIEEAYLPDDVVLLDYHKPKWLMWIAERNPKVMEEMNKVNEYLPKEWNIDENKRSESF